MYPCVQYLVQLVAVCTVYPTHQLNFKFLYSPESTVPKGDVK